MLKDNLSTPISLSEFLKVTPDNMNISVAKYSDNIFIKTTYEVVLFVISEDPIILVECTVHKRYTEFQGFYDSLTYRYQNLKFPSFPSKFQIVNVKESRKKFFDSLLKTVLKLAAVHPEIKKELLKLLYEFILEKNQGIQIKQISNCDKKSKRESMPHSGYFEHSSSIDKTSIGDLGGLSGSSGTNVKGIFGHAKKKSFDDTILRTKSFDKRMSSVPYVNDSTMIANMFNNENISSKGNIVYIYYLTLDAWQIEFKYLKNKFSRAYAKIMDQCLYLYDSIIANNYFFCLPLYKINFDIYKINDTKKVLIEYSEITETQEYLNSLNIKDFHLDQLKCEINLHLYHVFDDSELIIRFNSNATKFNELVSFVEILDTHSNAVKSQSKYIQPIDETNINIYGKLYFEFNQIEIPNFEGNVFANITFLPYTFKSKSVISKSSFSVKQMFAIPIHNRFEIMKIEIYSKSHQGLFHKKVVDEKLCEHLIFTPDVLNNYFFPNKMIIVELENTNKNVKNVTKLSISFKLKNYSNVLALVTKNRNKNVLEDMTIAKSEEDISIKNLMKRMKKIIILIKEFKEYYKTVFRFKYPIYSSIMCLILTNYFLFCNSEYFTSHILIFISYVIFVHSNFFNKYIYPFCDKFIFSVKNPYDFESTVQTKIDVENDEVKRENYLTHDQAEKKNIIKSIMEPIKTFKTYKNTYHQVLFKFTSFVANLEKIKNLFLWTDPLLTFYFIVIILCFVTLIYAIKFKYLMVFGILNKFISGVTHFKRKYLNNMEIADIVLRHCHKEWFNETKHKLKSAQSYCENKINNSSVNYPNSPRIILSTSSNTTIEENKNLDNIILFDDKFRLFIKEQLEKHADILIKIEFLNTVNKLGEIKDAISKSKSMLKIKKESQLHIQTRKNDKIYRSPLDIELILLYFVQNIKSDYYISKYYKVQTSIKEHTGGNTYTSISNNDIMPENKETKNDKDRSKERKEK